MLSFTHFTHGISVKNINKKKHGRAQPPEFSEVRGTSVLGGCRLLHQVSQTRAGQSAGGIVFFSSRKAGLFHHEDFLSWDLSTIMRLLVGFTGYLMLTLW